MKQTNCFSKSSLPNPKDPVKTPQSYAEMYQSLEKGEHKSAAKSRQGAGPKKKNGLWTLQLPEATWREKMKDLTFAQRCIFQELLYFQRNNKSCWPSKITIAKNLHAEIRTIERNLPVVIKKMNIKVIKQTGRSNHYEIPTPF